ARELDAVGDDGMAADLAVMRNMHIGHDPVVVAQASHAHVLRRPRIDGDVLAYGVAVADLEPGGFVAVFLVLGNAADGAETIEIVVCTYRGVAVDDTMRAHGGARPDHDVITDDAVWPDAYIAGDPGPGGNDRRRMDVARHSYSSSTRIAHMILASAASCPSTVACAVYLQMERLMRSAVTSRRSWSPGTTGLRKRAPSTPTR